MSQKLEMVNQLITDTKGASEYLDVSVQRINQLVKNGHLPALIFQDGKLARRSPDDNTRGHDLLFLRHDLATFVPPPRGRKPTPGSPYHGAHQKRLSAVAKNSPKTTNPAGSKGK